MWGREFQVQREAAGELTAADEHLGVLDVVHALAELHDEGPHGHVLLLKVRLQIVSRLAGLQKQWRDPKLCEHGIDTGTMTAAFRMRLHRATGTATAKVPQVLCCSAVLAQGQHAIHGQRHAILRRQTQAQKPADAKAMHAVAACMRAGGAADRALTWT